jgi:ribonuclease BN (tRNA processing enzyme)
MRVGVLIAAMISLSGCGWLSYSDKSTMPESSPADCPSEGAALQVLGSGGPIAEGPGQPGRAGSSYLLWIDAEPRLLIDAGAGSFLRFAEAGGKVATLDAILLTHLHADHVGDLAGILNSGGFEGRAEPLRVIGPDAAPRFPGTTEFLRRLLDKESGAFAYNGGYLDGTENKPLLLPREVTTKQGEAPPVHLELSDEVAVFAIPVNHGAAPSLGYAIFVGDKSVYLAADQNGFSPSFEAAIEGKKPDILIAHHVIHGGEGQPRGLHRTPEEIGQLAGLAQAQRLVLSHNMERSLSRIDEGIEAIARGYDGPVMVAADLDCFAL